MENVNWFGRRGPARQEAAAPMVRPATAASGTAVTPQLQALVTIEIGRAHV